MNKYKNVMLIKGDSFGEIPRLLGSFRGEKIGVFIDGPKGLHAVNLARQIYFQDERIKFICIHDIKYGSMQAEYCRNVFDDIIFTDNPSGYFSDVRTEIDSYMLELNKALCEESKSSLTPSEGLGYLQTLLKESPYGHGMAVIVRNE